MPRLDIPNSASIHNGFRFLSGVDFLGAPADQAVLALHPKWMYVEPLALVCSAAWGAWCRRQGYPLAVHNLGPQAAYAARMKLFEHLGVAFRERKVTEHEEAGRFLPIANVRGRADISPVIASVSALLHLDDEPETLAAVQYCVSELLRNVLEHSGSADGAFVCAHNYSKKSLKRVTLAVADCGRGVAEHLGDSYPSAKQDDRFALEMAMLPGVTGAKAGQYGTPENAGAGLFITRCIAKGSGGYFFISSGEAAYRVRRAKVDREEFRLEIDPLEERHDMRSLSKPWLGTVVSVEIRTDQIVDFEGYFDVIRKMIPRKVRHRKEIRFT